MEKNDPVADFVEKVLRNIEKELTQELVHTTKVTAGELFKKLGVQTPPDQQLDAKRTADYWHFDGRTHRIVQHVRGTR